MVHLRRHGPKHRACPRQVALAEMMVRRSPAIRIMVLQNLPELVRGGRRAGIESATSR